MSDHQSVITIACSANSPPHSKYNFTLAASVISFTPEQLKRGRTTTRQYSKPKLSASQFCDGETAEHFRNQHCLDRLRLQPESRSANVQQRVIPIILSLQNEGILISNSSDKLL